MEVQNQLTFSSDDDSEPEQDDGIGKAAGEESNDNFNNIHVFERLSKLLDKYSNPINISIDINVAEVILMILTLSIAHNMSLAAVCDVFKIINVICCTNLFPSTSHLFKQHFNPSFGMKIHYTCKHCKSYLGIRGEPDISKCKICNTMNNVKGYQYDNAFLTMDIKSQLVEILNNKNCKFSVNSPVNRNIYTDISSGTMYRNTIPYTDGDSLQYLSFTFNSDGTPISKDSKTTITPIYLMINELDVSSRRKHMILAGLWYGKIKPNMDVFLTTFVDIMIDLRTKGIKVKVDNKEKTVKLFCLCCCVDTVARAPMQGIIGVNGYYCCSWCETEGENDVDAVKYPFEFPFPPDRTEESFEQCYQKYAVTKGKGEDLKGVNNVSPLTNLPSFKMVWGFTPDYLHCVLLGITKRFLRLWMTGVGKQYYIGLPSKIKAIDKLIQKIKIPTCLKRVPVSLTKRRVMKGREFENWLLYFSVPLLAGFLQEKFFKHWKLLVCAISILLQDEVLEEQIVQADLLLTEFVYKIKDLYGSFEMTYNVHQLLHLAESVRKFGPLWTHTTFPFEAALGTCKRVLKATKGVPHQIVRNLEISRAIEFILQNYNCNADIKKVCGIMKKFKMSVANSVSQSSETLLGYIGIFEDTNISGLPNNVSYKEYNIAIIRDSKALVKKETEKDTNNDDSYVELKDGMFARIKHILLAENIDGDCYVVLEEQILRDEPGLIFTKKFRRIGKIFACKLNNIKNAAIKIELDETDAYMSSIPNKHYLLNM